MPLVRFSSTGKVNGKAYVEGDELQVSQSIADDLKNVQKCADEVSAPSKKSSGKKSTSE